jgi:hypothetical protein
VIVGLRVGSRELEAALRAAFRRHVVPAGEVPAHYSVRTGTRLPQQPARRGFHLLYEGTCVSMKTLDDWGLLDGLVDTLAVHDTLAADEVEVSAVALVDREDRAVLLPGFVRDEVVHAERRLNTRGFRLARPRTVRIDPGAGALVVPPPAIDVDRSAFARHLDTESEPPAPSLPAGRYPIRRWYLYDAGHVPDLEALGPVRALRSAMGAVIGLGDGSRAQVWRSLATLMPRIETMSAGEGGASALLADVTSSAAGL